MNYINLFYDYPIIKNTFVYAFIPAFIISFVLFVYLIILKNKLKNADNNIYKKKSAVIKNLIGLIMFGVICFIFVLCIQAFLDKSNSYNLEFDNNIIYYFILGSPVILIVIELSFIVRFVKAIFIKKEENQENVNIDESNDIIKTPEAQADDELLIKSAQKYATDSSLTDKTIDNNKDLEEIPSPEELEKLSKEMDDTDLEII